MQRKSPIQSFTGVDLKEAETVLSPQPGQMAKPRTKPPDAPAAKSVVLTTARPQAASAVQLCENDPS